MTVVDENLFPKIILVEGSAPSSPSAGDQKLYIDSSSHHLSRKNSSGTVVDLETNQAAGAPTAHGCGVKRASTSVSCGNNTLTAIAFDAEDFDTDTMHDNSTANTKITIPTISGVTTGLWQINACGYTDASTANVDAQFRVNGSTTIGFERTPASSSSVSGFDLSMAYVLTAADYVELMVRTTAGAGNVVFDAGGSPRFSVVFIGKVT